MHFLRQSTAVDVAIGPFVDATDGVTAETGLTLSQADIRLKKNNGAWAQVSDATSATHEENGWYEKELDATDTNTVGILKIAVHEAGALPVWVDFQVLEEAVFDALFAASALGYVANAPVNVAQFGGVNLTASGGRPEVNLSHIAGAAVSTTTAQLGVNAVQISGDGTAADNAEAFFDGTGYAGTNNVIPTVTTVTNLHASAATAAELAKVPKSDGTATWNATALASIQNEANDALVANHLDHLLAATYDPASKPGAADALLNELVESDAGVARFTANALEQGPGGGSAPTAAQIADAVWTEALADHSGVSGSTAEQLAAAGAAGDPWATALPGAYGSGTAGKIVGDNLNATVSSRLASAGYAAPLDAAGTRSAIGLASANLDTQLDALPTAAEGATAVWAAGTRRLTDGTNIVLAKGTGVTGFNDLSAAQVNAEVDAAIADAALPTAAQNADAVLDEVVEGSTTLRQSIRLSNAVLSGKASGLGTGTAVYRDIGDSKNRISASVDADGNRSSVTRDLT